MAQGDIKAVRENAEGTYDEILLNGLFAEPQIQVIGLTILQTGWEEGITFFEYDLSNENITANSIVEVIPDNEDYEIVVAAEILPATESTEGTVTIYAVNEPTDDIGVTINITEKAL